MRPLVEAINHHVERNRQQAEARRRFVDDASHQLRTPLTTLATQVGFALREPDPAQQRQALAAIKAQLDETVRQTNQMLLLARTDSAEIEPERVDLDALAQEVTRAWWSEARARGIDLGLEAAGGAVARDGAAGAAAGGAVEPAAQRHPLHAARRPGDGAGAPGRNGGRAIAVVDRARHPADELARAGERFFRGSNVRLPGSGLGLAIVRSIAERLGGELRLAPGAPEGGLRATIALPALGRRRGETRVNPRALGECAERRLKVPLDRVPPTLPQRMVRGPTQTAGDPR